MSLTGFQPLWDKILSQNLQAVADQGCHLEGSSPFNYHSQAVFGGKQRPVFGGKSDRGGNSIRGPLIGGYTVHKKEGGGWGVTVVCTDN
jgi:hypothetical protein